MADNHVDSIAAKIAKLSKVKNSTINYGELANNIQFLIDSGEPIPKDLLDSFRSIVIEMLE